MITTPGDGVSLFEEILRPLWTHNTARFLLIWITTTAAAAVCVAVAVGLVAAPRSQVATKRPTNLSLAWQKVRTPRTVAMLTFLAVFLASYIAMNLTWENFAYYDDEYFTQITLKGYNIYPLINADNGRFFPLGFQEFNVIRHFTVTITGYHALPIIQLLIVFLILLILDTELTIAARATLAILALLTPSILTSLNGLIFPERNVLFFLACLALSIRHFEQTRSIIWAVAAVVSAQIMIYEVETLPLLLLAFAAGRLILRCRNGRYAGWDPARLWDKESRLDLCLTALGLLFLLYYFAVMGIHGNMNYAVTTRQPRAEVVLSYMRVDLLAWLFVAFVVSRIFLVMSHRMAPSLLWDGLALGGVVCFLAYLYLSMFSIYYLAATDLIAVLYVGRFAVLSWAKMRSWSKTAALLLAFTILFQDVLVSAFAIFDRKNVIHAKAEIASVVKTRFRSNDGNFFRLFFPFASRYTIMEFAAYLNYRGLPVEGARGETGLNSVVLATRAIAEDGPCVEWTSIRCHAVSGPAPGDLVIVLPDDLASLAEASAYRESVGELLFLYKPPPIGHGLRSLFDSLHIYTWRYTPKTNPDRWLDGSVTLWR